MKPALLIVAVCFAIISLPIATFAQSQWHIELRGGRTVAGIVQSDLNSKGGWNIGLGVGHDLPGGVQLYAHGAYHRLESSPNVITIVSGIRPAPRDLSDPSVGTAFLNDPFSSLYEGSIELRVISPGTVVAPFLSIQSGVYILKPADIVTEGVMPVESYAGGYVVANRTLVKGFASLGLGTQVALGDRVALGLSANYARTFDGDFVLLPIVSTIGFRF